MELKVRSERITSHIAGTLKKGELQYVDFRKVSLIVVGVKTET